MPPGLEGARLAALAARRTRQKARRKRRRRTRRCRTRSCTRSSSRRRCATPRPAPRPPPRPRIPLLPSFVSTRSSVPPKNGALKGGCDLRFVYKVCAAACLSPCFAIAPCCRGRAASTAGPWQLACHGRTRIARNRRIAARWVMSRPRVSKHTQPHATDGANKDDAAHH